MGPDQPRDAVPPIVREFPAQLGDVAEIFRRRRIGAALDPLGNVIFARPDSIEVDFHGRTARRQEILELAKHLDGDNADAAGHFDAEGTGVLTVQVPTSTMEISREERWPMQRLNEAVAHFRSNGVNAGLRYVVFGAGVALPPALTASSAVAASMGIAGRTTNRTPAGKPVMLTTAQPSVRPSRLREPLNLSGHRRPRVLVLDGGLRTTKVDSRGRRARRRPEHADLRWTESHQRLRVHIHKSWRAEGRPEEIDDEDEPDDDNTGTLDFQAGHGTFITGIVRQICPDAEIHPAGVLSSFGEGDTSQVLATVRRLKSECGPFDLVVMSFGAYFTADHPGLFGSRLSSVLGSALGVAAAGNQQGCRPYFPAALPEVIAVGSCTSAGRSWFSNFGPWVDACAPATDVCSTFFDDFTEVVGGKPRRRFREWARWSGTSFAAPKVAGAIAQEMYVSQVSAREAWRRLSSTDRLRIPDLGVVFNL